MAYAFVLCMTYVNYHIHHQNELIYPEARISFMAFVRKQQADLPVSGIYEIRTTFSEAWKARRIKELTAECQQKDIPVDQAIDMEEWEPYMVCKWSYDGDREVLLSFPEGNQEMSFIRTKEYYVGESKGQFHIHEKIPSTPTPVHRPYLFYYGMNDSFMESFKRANRVTIIRNNPYGGDTLCIYHDSKAGKAELQLQLDCQHRLRKYQFYGNGELIGQVEIDAYHVEGSKAFPSRAKHVSYRYKHPSEYAERTMIARSIQFPGTPQEIRDAMSFHVPKNSHVVDHQLKQQGYVARDADIQEVLDKKVPLLNMVDTSTPGLLLLAGWLYYRHRKLSGLTG